MTANTDLERFRNEADKYAAYLETPEGRLRLDLAFANLQEFLPRSTRSLHALDIGCGTGANAIRLAQLGVHVTVLDTSQSMLELAERAAREAQVSQSVELRHGDADQLLDLFDAASFDVILCHNVLEFVEDPNAVLRTVACVLRGSSGIVSILIRNQPGEVLKAALLNGDLAAAERNLNAEWGDESLYGGKVRLFTPESLQKRLLDASLVADAVRGVRVLSDYLPPKVSRTDEYERIFDLERQLGRQPEFAAIARYTHCLAHPDAPAMENMKVGA
jgi:S-adenosylmethionine-dependent methyltransferase